VHHECKLGPDGFCLPGSSLITPFQKTTWKSKWDWQDERALGGAHYASDDFDGVKSKYRYALWSFVVDGPDSLKAPWANSPKFFPEPENTALGKAIQLDDPMSLASQRMRSTFAPPMTLVASHIPPIIGQPCATIDPHLIRYMEQIWKIDPGPEIVIGNKKSIVRDISLMASIGSKFNDILFPSTATDGYQFARLDSDAAGLWIADSVGISTMQTLVSSERQPAASLGLPAVLWVDTLSEAPKWALVQPSSSSETDATFGIVNQGSLGTMVGRSAKLIPEARGFGALLLDASNLQALLFDHQRQSWRAVNLPSELYIREGASFVLNGTTLLAVGGRDRSGLQSEGWVIDLPTGSAQQTDLGFPARENSRLGVSADGSTYTLTGGRDANGAHDDVWLFRPEQSAKARVLRTDTTQASKFNASLSAVVADETSVSAVALNQEVASFQLVERTAAGWNQVKANDEACQNPDAGKLCKLDASWWATPGILGCTTGSSLGCDGVKGQAAWETHLPSGILDVAPTRDGFWTVSKKTISFWHAGPDQKPTLVVQKSLPNYDYRFGTGAQTLLLTSGGVSIVEFNGTTIDVGPATPLCGRPLKAASVGNGTWTILTTMGMGVVDTTEKKPVLVSMSALLPIGDKAGWAAPMQTDRHSLAICTQIDRFLPTAVVPILRDGMAVSSVGAKHAAAVVGPFVYALDLSKPATPEVTDVSPVLEWMPTLRWNSSGQFLFLSGTLGMPSTSILFRADDGQLTPIGTHNLTDWSNRLDGENISAIHHANGFDVAWVSR